VVSTTLFFCDNAIVPLFPSRVREKYPTLLRQGCQFGFFEAKFVIFDLFSTLLVFFIFEKRPNDIWLFLAFFGHIYFYVESADLKMILAGSGHWQISRHCFWTQNDKFSLETLHENL